MLSFHLLGGRDVVWQHERLWISSGGFKSRRSPFCYIPIHNGYSNGKNVGAAPYERITIS